MRRIAICCGLALVVIVPPAAGGLYEDIYRGLDLFVTPTGSPINVTGDGRRINGSRSGRLRFNPDELGRGWALEIDRTFGPDTAQRPEIFDLGPYELEVTSGTTAATVGYTNRGFTGNSKFLIGNLDASITNLQYSLRFESGAQDVELRGILDSSVAIELNQIGFYSANITVNHTDAQFKAEGLAAELLEDTDFDIGPIVVKGNIVFDAVVAALTTMGVDTGPLEGIFPKSPIDRINDAIREQFAAHAAVAGVQVSAETSAALVGPPSSYADARGAAAGALAFPGTAKTGGSDPVVVPEPGTLALLVGGSVVALGVRRRRRMRR